jgi:HEAT repeat protein
MKKPTRFEAAYHALARIGSGPITEDAVAEIKRALESPTSLLVAKAAEIAGRRGLTELIPDMASAFDRFLADGARVDKQCNAKTSIAEALNKLEYMGNAVLVAGARYLQMEPAFGGPADTAAGLRCACASGLARIEHPDAHYVLADLLVDPERTVRSAAARALAYLGSPEGEVLLRLKALTGDSEPDVISECFTGLMTMAPERSLDFVARYLRSGGPAVSESAALAIGGSRLPRAYDTLRQHWDDEVSPTVRRRLLLPIALIRSTEAFNFLLEVVRTADTKTAAHAVSALRIYADDESVRKRRPTRETTTRSTLPEPRPKENGRSSIRITQNTSIPSGATFPRRL